MNNWERQLNNLPKAKLGVWADLKIKIKLYRFIIYRNFKNFWNFGWLNFKTLSRPALLATLAVLVMAATSVYAYAGGNITQENVLYPLRRAVESLEEKTSFSPTAKVNTYSKFSERRLQEALTLSQKSLEQDNVSQQETNQHIEDSLDEAVANIGSLVDNSQGVTNQKNKRDNLERFKEKEKSTKDYLKKIEDNAQADSNDEVVKKVNEVRENIRRYQAILEDDHQAEDQTPTLAEPDVKPEVKGWKDKGSEPTEDKKPSPSPESINQAPTSAGNQENKTEEKSTKNRESGDHRSDDNR